MRLLIALASLVGATGLAWSATTLPKSDLQPGPPVARPAPAAAPASEAPALTRADVQTWLDGFISHALRREDVAGAVVVIVKDGQILFEKGYGYSDVARRIPVDPQRTLFRPGSIGKTFTWTAVMQLVEQGKIDLDRDINTYLDFKIPDAFGKPITMRHLMTHTAGFEETSKEVIGTDPDNVPSIGDYVKQWVPDRIFAPGTIPAYSNYGTALAGYIVERVSGQTYHDYIDRHILVPLGMVHSSTRQPLPAKLQPLMSKGYQLGSSPAKPYELLGPAPAGSIAASGGDMARFMIAHLQNGTFGNARILKPETAQKMHNTPMTILPAVNRMVLGFYEATRNGRKIIGHSGDSQWFHSAMRLFLDDNIGLFVSINSAGRSGASHALRADLFEKFTDRYLPPRVGTLGNAASGGSAPPDEKTAAAHAKLMEGLYDSTRRSSSNFFSMSNLLGQTEVVANADGTLSIEDMTDIGDQPRKWREIAPFVWREVGGQDLLSARVEQGKVVLFGGREDSPYTLYQPVPWSTSSSWLVPALLASLAVLALTVALWPVEIWTRRRHRIAFPYSGNEARAYWAVRIASLAILIALAGFFALFSAVEADFTILTTKLDIWIWLLQLLCLVAFVGGTGIALWNVWTMWKAGRPWSAKLWSLAIVLSCLVILWVGAAFKLIALTIHY